MSCSRRRTGKGDLCLGSPRRHFRRMRPGSGLPAAKGDSMKRAVLGLVLALSLAASPALALTALTNNDCASATPDLGIADKIDGTGGGALGAGSGAPYNLDKTDDALVCANEHIFTASVNTSAKFINEVANTISHELGHLLGLEH